MGDQLVRPVGGGARKGTRLSSGVTTSFTSHFLHHIIPQLPRPACVLSDAPRADLHCDALVQVLATKVRKTLSAVRKDEQPIDSVTKSGTFNYSTTRLMKEYLTGVQKERNGSLLYKDVFKSPFDGFCTDAEARLLLSAMPAHTLLLRSEAVCGRAATRCVRAVCSETSALSVLRRPPRQDCKVYTGKQ